MLWPTLLALGEVARRRGALDETAVLRAAGREQLSYIVEHIGDDGLQASFLALPAVQEGLDTSVV